MTLNDSKCNLICNKNVFFLHAYLSSTFSLHFNAFCFGTAILLYKTNMQTFIDFSKFYDCAAMR